MKNGKSEETVNREVHACQCDQCESGQVHAGQAMHQQMNLLMSRLDEQQRRWYAALESSRIGYGGDKVVAAITGLDEQTIRRGRSEMEASLVGRPTDRVRVEGGGRPMVEKKHRKSSMR